MPAKLSIEHVKEKLKPTGFELIGNYIRSDIKTVFKCPLCRNSTELTLNMILNGVKSCGCSRQKNLAGTKIGSLMVLDRPVYQTGKSNKWRCVCDCGIECFKYTHQLRGDGNKCCNKCSEKLRDRQKACGIGSTNKMWTGIGTLSGDTLYTIKTNAKKRNINFFVTKENIWDKFIEQKKSCYFTNTAIDFTGTASVDRLNNDLAYTPDNIVIVHKLINRMKLDFSVGHFNKLCNLILNPITTNINKDFDYYIQRNERTGYKGIPGILIAAIRLRKASKLGFDIDSKFLWNLFLKQKGLCSLTGQSIYLESDKFERTASLDRIDSSKGYVRDNVQWVHVDVNRFKWNLSESNLKYWCGLVVNNPNKDRI